MALLAPVFLAMLAFGKDSTSAETQTVSTSYQQPVQPMPQVQPIPTAESVQPMPEVVPVMPVASVQPEVTPVQETVVPEPTPVTSTPVQPEQPTVNQNATPAFCTNCGSSLMPNAKFCTNCGKQI